MHFDLMCLPLPLQQAPFPFAKIESHSRRATPSPVTAHSPPHAGYHPFAGLGCCRLPGSELTSPDADSS